MSLLVRTSLTTLAVADSVAADVAARAGVGWCRVVRPLNRGADARPLIGQPRRTFSKSG